MGMAILENTLEPAGISHPEPVVYGGFSPFVKNVLDRNIGYILPFFELRKERCITSPAIPTGSGCGFRVWRGSFPEEQAVFRRLAEPTD